MANTCHNATGVPAARFSNAHGETDASITNLLGLATALRDIASETNAIDHAHRDAAPLAALIQCVEEKAKEVARLHEIAFRVYSAEKSEAV
ncbi:hypothetical protein PAF17_18995 [Paracoccus sp. Z330]|uniref:Uncharacterized protein n=1 Tax=Paracoccus onchidii TaxID=3017813 RepID=A0ABT4ZJV3_9RHOB|nr:hypothetical protein [Paracoccus onchidii]MDB6179562.1 hypothetical protein [Paracoccus onchidii]